MKASNRLLSVAVLFICGTMFADDAVKTAIDQVKASSKAGPEIKKFVESTLAPQSTNAVFAEETVKQNAKKVSLDQIKKLDKEWTDAEEMLPIQTEKTSNACAIEIKKIVAGHPAIVEAFVMDDQGANVGQNNLTSDYWQGDEPKWQNSYNGGKGGADVGEAKFDKSANTVLQQISLPIVSKDGKVVGAITWGIAIDKLK